jgi:hypothetical protein
MSSLQQNWKSEQNSERGGGGKREGAREAAGDRREKWPKQCALYSYAHMNKFKKKERLRNFKRENKDSLVLNKMQTIS